MLSFKSFKKRLNDLPGSGWGGITDVFKFLFLKIEAIEKTVNSSAPKSRIATKKLGQRIKPVKSRF